MPDLETLPAEAVRRAFAAEWAKVGAAWGVAPSTAAVQGYLLLAAEPCTEADLRDALGLSHRAVFGALEECRAWGLIEEAEPRRSGRRGPAGRAWRAVGDHWEWFRRVAASRKERETDPVLPLLDDVLARAGDAGDPALLERTASLVAFVRAFDRGVGLATSTDAATIARLFGALERLDDQTVRALVATLGALDERQLVTLARRLSKLSPALLRLIR